MGIEIERKYLIKKPDLQLIKNMPGCEIRFIRQTYLKGYGNIERRIRHIDTNGNIVYTYTEKTKISSMSRNEFEKEITAEEYYDFLSEADPTYATIDKERFSFPYEGKIIEIDIYKNFENYSCLFFNKAIMEIELENEYQEPIIPVFIEMEKDGEITGKNEFSNKNISKHLANAKTAPYLETYFNYRIKPVGLSYPLIKNNVHIHDKESLENEGFLEVYNEYGLKTHNHHNIEISLQDKIDIAKAFFDDKRTLFQREEERIISTEAFRRLQYKTQVMVNSASDDQRTRLLHSLDVEKISRKIAIALGANCQLAETIAIGHDIGHTPFGHAGEYAIRDYLEEHFAGSFSHAIQGVKVLDFLCSHRTLKPLGIRGLGISKHVLEGVLKHDTDSFSEDISSAAYRLQYDCSDLFIPVGYDNENKFQGVLLGGIETQIVCWADKIAYMSHDWEEFVSMGYLEKMLNRVNMIIIQMFQMYKKHKYCESFPIACNIEFEKDSIKNIVQQITELNKLFNENDTPSKDIMIIILDKIIMEIEERLDKYNSIPNINMKNFKSNNNFYFSTEQYKTLHSFFSVAKSWIIITDEIPSRIGTKVDAIFIIYNYLCKLLPHTTTPALIDKIINKSKKNINGYNREEFITLSNETLNKKLNKKMKSNQKKEVIKESFLVNFEEDAFYAVKGITDFIKAEYNKSTRIANMNYTAKQIIKELYRFYSTNPSMLPLKQRNRIEQEFMVAASSFNSYGLQNSLLEYYYLKLKETKDNKEARKKVVEFLGKVLIIKVINKNAESKKNGINFNKYTSLTSFKMNFGVKPEEIRRVITLRVITDYIAGMTDRMAEMKYNEIVSSNAQWSQEYTERATFSVY